MKKSLTLTLLLLLHFNINGQTIRDSVYNNVILISNTDVTTNGNDFLIDIPIKPQKEPIVIFNNDNRIPLNLFFDRKSFLSEQNELLLITPDWEFQKEIIEREKREGIHIKASRNKIYYIQRNFNGYHIDSLIISLHSRPIVKLNFKKPELLENEVKYYYTECYGSTCCPYDINWDFLEDRNKSKNNFNKKYSVNVNKDIYEIGRGKEGEHCNYYLLADLTNEQRIEFYQIFKEVDFTSSQIYVPIILNKEITK